MHGPASTTVTPCTTPASSKRCSMPSFLPRSPSIAMALQLDFDINAGRKLQAHQRIHGATRWLQDVDQPLVRTHFELLTRVFIDERPAQHGELLNARGQRHGAGHGGAGALGGLHDLLGRLVEDAVVERFEADANRLSWHRATR